MRLAILVLTFCLWLTADSAAQPRLVMEPAQLDFGVVAQNETRHAEVTLRNRGDEVLVLGPARSTCHCVEPVLAITELPPGAAAVMGVLFNSLDFQGPQLKHIKFATNDPQRPQVEYLVTADIKVPLSMEPAQTLLSFPALRAGQTSSQTYTFRSEDVDRLEIRPRHWPRQWLEIDVRPGDTPQAALVTFTIKPDGPVGRYRDMVRLETNVPAVPLVALEVDVRLVADLMLDLDRVNLGMVRPGHALQSRVQVKPLQAETHFSLIRAEIDIPGLTARVLNDQGASFAVIEGQALAGDHPLTRANHGRIQGTLRIFSDLQSTPELQVPVTYMLRL